MNKRNKNMEKYIEQVNDDLDKNSGIERRKVKEGVIGENRVYASSQRISTKTMALIAVMTAVTCVLAPLSIPIGPVPISLTNLAIYFGLYILGMKKETVSYMVYLLIGFVGVPVFSGFTGGAGKLLGPTGGYLIGFIPMAIVAGILIDKSGGKVLPSVIGMVAGTAVCYGLGTAWFCIQAHYEVMPALALCVIPFLPGDAVKIAIAAFFGPQIRRAIKRIG